MDVFPGAIYCGDSEGIAIFLTSESPWCRVDRASEADRSQDRGGIVHAPKSLSGEIQRMCDGAANFAEYLILDTPDPDKTKKCYERCDFLQFFDLFGRISLF